MRRLSNKLWLLVVSVLANGAVAEDRDDKTQPEVEFLEFLGQMGDEAAEWDEFMDIADGDLPPVMAETDYE